MGHRLRYLGDCGEERLKDKGGSDQTQNEALEEEE